MPPPNRSVERRRTLRMRLKGSVLVHHGGPPLHGRIQDVSAGGVCARIQPDSRAEIPALAQHDVVARLRLDGAQAEWVEVSGSVIRTTPELVVISIDKASPAFDAMIRHELSASVETSRSWRVLLVDDDPVRAARLVEVFATNGYEVAVVATPLEAIVRVGEARYEPHVIAMAETIPEGEADQLRRFFAREHPGSQIVTLGQGGELPPDPESWGTAAEPHVALRVRMRRLLSRARRRRRDG